MKCVRSTKTGIVGRLSEAISRQAVLNGWAVYVPKHVWKKEVRDV